MGYILAILISGVMSYAPLNNFNNKFAQGVDAGNSCWNRVGGAVGEYGQPSDYSLDLICNWRLKSSTTTQEVTSWELVRD